MHTTPEKCTLDHTFHGAGAYVQVQYQFPALVVCEVPPGEAGELLVEGAAEQA